MSYWTYVNGTVTVSPLGRTQAEKRYILETVLDHLPFVTGSEKDMDVYILQKAGHNHASSHTEFGEWGGYRNWKTLSTEVQSEYILVVDGALRDRKFDQTYREFQNWLCRLAKRVPVEDVLVEVRGYDRSSLVRNPHVQRKSSFSTVYEQMFEDPSWSKSNDTGEPTWCEYLMYDRAKNSDFPMILGYKYYNDEENDREVERRLAYLRD